MSLIDEPEIDIVPASEEKGADGAADDDRSPAQAAATLYRHHLFAAHHFSDLACEIEKEQHGVVADADVIRRHRSYVIGSVLSATAFLEGSINELYLEVQEHLMNGAIANRVLALPAHFWSSVAKPPILHKYQLALVVADAEPFDESRSPFRDADCLVALRDALVHGRPEWRDAHGRRQNLERRLRAKFKHNGLASDAEPEFPDRLLGAGCATWAVRIAERFSDDFCHRMVIPSRAVTTR